LARHYQKIESEIRKLRDLNFEKFDYHGKEMGGGGEPPTRPKPPAS
jgi:hypothetical protein